MSDNLGRTQPEDPTKINLHQEWEIRYWCKVLGVTEAKLREAVRAVGNSVAAVRRYLGK
jgi:hypothetical protein